MAFCRQQGWDFLILVRMMVNSFVRLLSLSSRLGNEGAIRAADIVCAGKEFLAYMGIGLAAVPFELRRRPELIPYNDVVRL